MSNVFLKEERVKAQMINAILTYSNKYNSREELEAKNFSVLKFMYYDVMLPVYCKRKMAC